MQSAHLFTSTVPSCLQLNQQLRGTTSGNFFFGRGWSQHRNSLVRDAGRGLLHGYGVRKARISGWSLNHRDYATRATRAEAMRVGMALTVERVGSWESLSEKLGVEKFGPSERVAHAKERLFGSDKEPKLVFYRDNSSWCPYCERVWLQLEEKRISYSVEKINMRCYGEKPAWYTRMVPSGLLPAVMLDGQLLTDSLDIMFILEEKFPSNNPLLFERGTPEFDAVDSLLKLERELFGAWLTRLTRLWGDRTAFESTMDSVNSALELFNGPYFLGSKFSLVDAVFTPFLERIAASMPYWPGIQVRGADQWPAVNAWFDAMDSRPSYQAIKSDDFGITHSLEPQIGGCISADAGASYRALIDGTDGSWDLPLKPEVTAWGTDDGTGKGGAKEEAAQCLIANHEQVVRFALRGLEDGEKHRASVDLGFRHVAGALLSGVENVETPKDLPKEVAIAAAYLRDRVGMPRDLTYPAARQLRAQLQWLVKHSGSGLGLEESERDDQKSWLELAEESELELVLQESKSENGTSGIKSWLYPSKDELPDEKEMTIFDHLEELRERLLVSVAAVGVAIIGCFCFAKDLIILLEAPVYSQGVRFLQLSPGEYFFTTLKVSGYCGLLIGIPVILYEIIAFVVPGLTRSERRFLGPIVLGSSILFYTGVGFSYTVLTPAALNFFVNYAEGAVESLWSIDQYFEFVLVLLFSTGLSFQVPVIQLLLGQTRLVTADQMLSAWRYVVVGAVVAAAVLTPSTDPLTQILLAGPLIGLYIGGAFLVKFLALEPEPS